MAASSETKGTVLDHHPFRSVIPAANVIEVSSSNTPGCLALFNAHPIWFKAEACDDAVPSSRSRNRNEAAGKWFCASWPGPYKEERTGGDPSGGTSASLSGPSWRRSEQRNDERVAPDLALSPLDATIVLERNIISGRSHRTSLSAKFGDKAPDDRLLWIQTESSLVEGILGHHTWALEDDLIAQ